MQDTQSFNKAVAFSSELHVDNEYFATGTLVFFGSSSRQKRGSGTHEGMNEVFCTTTN